MKNLKINLISHGINVFACILMMLFFILDVTEILYPKEPVMLSNEMQQELTAILDTNYPERNNLLKPLEYTHSPLMPKADFEIFAESAILVDAESGSILYEKNCDQLIPPASMTKLVEMYVIFNECKKGTVSLDDIVPLPRESWAINLPSDASIMFLAQNQKVTLKELLLGLAIASGNDASIAAAKYVKGSMDAFVDEMNSVCSNLSMENTYFVESSGYSEENITTAREFAGFAREYIKKFPEAIPLFHSQRKLEYPQEHNLPDYQKENAESQKIIQYNTNKLLGKLPGCDGLKTGFIYESGYNLALTALRNGQRYISVTMKGPGTGSKEGNHYRSLDGTNLMEYAFNNFSTYTAGITKGTAKTNITLKVNGTSGKSGYVNLVPVFDESFSVPLINGMDPETAKNCVTKKLECPVFLKGCSVKGNTYGYVVYSLNNVELCRIPLIADRSIGKFGSAKIRNWFLELCCGK